MIIMTSLFLFVKNCIECLRLYWKRRLFCWCFQQHSQLLIHRYNLTDKLATEADLEQQERYLGYEFFGWKSNTNDRSLLS